MSVEVITPTVFDGIPVTGGFTTRAGGVSRAPFAALNLGAASGDDPAAVEHNISLLAAHAGVAPDAVARMKQVHGTTIRTVAEGGISADCDALVTVTPGVLLVVKTADCVPVLIADTTGRAVAAIHCGWRSIAGGIVGRVLADLAVGHGINATDLVAAVGPAIGPCCYEIGPEVADRLYPESLTRVDGRLYGDLKSEVARRLVDGGIDRSCIDVEPSCTACDTARFFSYRRDGARTGRMAGFIMTGSSA